MARLLNTRSFGVACLAVMMVSLSQVSGDDPCYQSITDIPCPSAEGVFDTCAYQLQQGTKACDEYTYTARQSGPYGEGATKPCLTLQVQTGTKCVPETDDKGIVVRRECANKYKCKFDFPSCAPGDKLKSFTADVYKLDKTGCIQPPTGD